MKHCLRCGECDHNSKTKESLDRISYSTVCFKVPADNYLSAMTRSTSLDDDESTTERSGDRVFFSSSVRIGFCHRDAITSLDSIRPIRSGGDCESKMKVMKTGFYEKHGAFLINCYRNSHPRGHVLDTRFSWLLT